MASSRPIPYAGMAVKVMYFAASDDAVIDEVLDGGRTLVVDGEAYTLRPVNARYVLADDPPYGTWLLLPRPESRP